MSDSELPRMEAAPDSVPLIEGEVSARWISVTGHMAYEHYAAVFGQALDTLLRDHLGFTSDKGSHMDVMRSANEYLHPLRAGDRFSVEARMLDWNPTHMRVFFQLWHDDEIAVTCEELVRYVNDRQHRTLPFPAEVRQAIERLHVQQAGLPLPPQAGVAIAIPL